MPQDTALASVGRQLFLMPNWSFLAKLDGEFAAGGDRESDAGIAGSADLAH
jgi:hypothetical protein